MENIYIFILILLCIIIICLIISILNNKHKECFNNKWLIIFVGYKFDNYDIDFINKWNKYVDFITVSNGDNKYRIQCEESSFLYIERDNIGYDAGAWKFVIINYYDTIRKYDYVLLLNNSCYYYKMNLFNIMSYKDYDILAHHKDIAHIDSYFTVFSKHIINTNDFLNYWKNLKSDMNRSEAVSLHEYKYYPHFRALGYKCKSYYKGPNMVVFPYLAIKHKTDIIKKRHHVFYNRFYNDDKVKNKFDNS